MNKDSIKINLLTILTSAVVAAFTHELLNNSDFRQMLYELALIILRNYPIQPYPM